MRKKIIISSIALLIILSIGVLINCAFYKPTQLNYFIASKIYKASANQAFTDENFYKCVVDTYNKENSPDVSYTTNLTNEQLNKITSLYCSGYHKKETEKIISTNGLEKLTALTNLDVEYNQLTSLDVSNNPNLTELKAGFNQLTSLNVSNNPNLTSLDASSNQLTSLDISNNTELENLYLGPKDPTAANGNEEGNLLSSINLLNNKKIKKLSLASNRLSDINVSENLELLELILFNNNISELNVSENKKLKILSLGFNYGCSSVDSNFACPRNYGNNISEINLDNNIDLEKLYISNNKLTELSLNKNSKIKSLQIGNNNLNKLSINALNNLYELEAGYNQLTSLDISNNTKLKYLLAERNQLTSLDVSNNPDLRELYAYNNKLTSLDVSNNTALTNLHASSNQLTSLDVSNNPDLRELYAHYNQLTSLDVSNNPDLRKLYAYNNKLTSLDVSNNFSLNSLYIDSNPYGQNKYVYKNNVVDFSDVVKIPDHLNWSHPVWTSGDTNIATVDSEGLVTTINAGCVNIVGKESNKYTISSTINVIEAISNKYNINAEEGYIYTGVDTDPETILNNINLNYGEASIEDNQLMIKYEGELIKSFDIVNITSDKYDLTKDYIFDYEENDITINNGTLNKNIENNTLEIKYGEDILETYKLVEVNSEEYNLSSSTIKIKDNTINEFIDKINCINCEAKIYDGENYLTEGEFADNSVLRIIYEEDVLEEYNLTFPVNSITLNKESVRLGLEKENTVQLEATINPKNAENKTVSWTSSNEDIATVDSNGLVTSVGLGKTTITATTEDGGIADTVEINVVEIITYTLTYQDENTTYEEEYEENEEVTLKSDITKEGYTLIGWELDDTEYKLTDEFIMPDEDITLDAIWKLINPDIEETSEYKVKNNIITGISLGTKVEELELGLDDIYEMKVYNKKGELKIEGSLATSDKVKIYLGDTLVSEYTLSVKGDVRGTGTSTVSDVAKLYQFLKGKITMEDCYKEAGNVVSTDNEIKINDVAKLYQFIKKKIESLED